VVYILDAEVKPSPEELLHFGVKGMRWGVRRSDKELSNEKPKKSKKKVAAKVATGVLAVSLTAVVATNRRNVRKNREAQKVIQETLATPFKWKDRAGDWHKYAKEGGKWVLDPLNMTPNELSAKSNSNWSYLLDRR
jgi:hypothetical protein